MALLGLISPLFLSVALNTSQMSDVIILCQYYLKSYIDEK